MIKGVNKQVLEINETQNGFFEKAIFFVKPEYSGMGEGRLKESAKKEIENAGKPPVRSYKYKNERIKNIFIITAVFVTGVVVGIASATLL
ncbi:MAG: hypothetical protein UGF89_05055 [Acutalibacteraceae bacterium]|nr:hypothetical protein [Acutalibacteraceae bacterium]